MRARLTARQAFPKLEPDLETWTNEYTGEVRHAVEPVRAEAKADYSISSGSIARRNAFFEGHVKVSKRDVQEEEGKEAEQIQFQIVDRNKDLQQASAYVGKSTHGASSDATDRGQATALTFARGYRSDTTQSKQDDLTTADRVMEDALDGVSAKEQAEIRLRMQLKNETMLGEQVDVLVRGMIESYDQKDAKLLATVAPDVLARVAGGIFDARATESESDKLAAQLAWDILTERPVGVQAGDTIAAQQKELDLLFKQALEQQVRSHSDRLIGSSVAAHGSRQQGLSKQETLEIMDAMRMAPDIQAVVSISRKFDHKRQDPVLTEQIGRWAFEILSSSPFVDKTAIRKGLKPEGLQALGRVTLQLFHTQEAQQKRTSHVRDADAGFEHDKQGGVQLGDIAARVRRGDSTGKTSLDVQYALADDMSGAAHRVQIRSSRDLFKAPQTTVHQDLQAMQLLPFNEAADVVLDNFIETLKKEVTYGKSTVTQSRMDVLASLLTTEASNDSSDVKLKSELRELARRKEMDETGVGIVGKVSDTVRMRNDTTVEETARSVDVDFKGKAQKADRVRRYAETAANATGVGADDAAKEGISNDRYSYAVS